MLPVKFLRNTSTYNLYLNEVKITAKVVERQRELIEADVDELRSKLDTSYPIVGFDIKYTTTTDSKGLSSIAILVLYVREHCLLVKFDTQMNYSTDSLFKFLNDSSICFLGWGQQELIDKVKAAKCSERLALETCVSVSTLAVRVLRNKDIIEQCGSLDDLSIKVGNPIFQAQAKKTVCDHDLDGTALFYTEDEMKFAIEDAFKCYTIGTHLMERVPKNETQIDSCVVERHSSISPVGFRPSLRKK